MNPAERVKRITALAERSSYVENVLRHALVSSLASVFWGRDPSPSLQIFNSEVDDSGFDVVLSLGDQVRYVQLKQTHEDKVPPNCSVRLSFAALPVRVYCAHVTHAEGIADLSVPVFRRVTARPAPEHRGLQNADKT